ncbi:MAG: hypothetical protein V4603_16640, partial [Pseudomonadota bacterium]
MPTAFPLPTPPVTKVSYPLTAQWLGALAAMLALAVMFGWHTHNEVLIQLRADLVVMPYNSALLM